MNNPNEVQPVDSYIQRMLERLVEEHKLKINPKRPTRAQRLEAALAIQDEHFGYYSMEIMVGRRVDAGEDFVGTFTMLKLANSCGKMDARSFYDGFAHQYWPKKTETLSRATTSRTIGFLKSYDNIGRQIKKRATKRRGPVLD